jgi:hypothetical protein
MEILAVINERSPVGWNVMAFLFKREILLGKKKNNNKILNYIHVVTQGEENRT